MTDATMFQRIEAALERDIARQWERAPAVVPAKQVTGILVRVYPRPAPIKRRKIA